MPVRKFRSVEAMDDSLWFNLGDPQLPRAIASVWSFGHKTVAIHFPPGVYKHRTIDAAANQAESWQEANFRAHQERLARKLQE